MAKYIVSYDILNSSTNGDAIREELERLGAKRALLSQWAINTDMTAVQLRDHLKGHIDDDDRMLVNSLSGWASRKTLIDLNTDI